MMQLRALNFASAVRLITSQNRIVSANAMRLTRGIIRHIPQRYKLCLASTVYTFLNPQSEILLPAATRFNVGNK